MVDPGTGMIALGSAPLVLKILGPTADYLGEQLQEFTEKRVENLKRIFAKAGDRLGTEGLDAPGGVPPRVLAGILDQGSFTDDELMAEYLGGVLASSKSEVSRDDRGTAVISLITSLSAYQVRAHYLFYKTIHDLFGDTGRNLGNSADRQKSQVYMPGSVFAVGMDFAEQERPRVITDHALNGLVRHDLIPQEFTRLGPSDDLSRLLGVKDIPEPGLVFGPSNAGVELFCWAHGKRDLNITDFLKKGQVFTVDPEIEIPPGSTPLENFPRS